MGLFSRKVETVEEEVDVKISDIIGDFTPVYDGIEKEYYFHYCGKMNQGHILETPDRKPIYGAEIIKFNLFGKSEYDFVDHLNNKRAHHLIGKLVTTSSSYISIFGSDINRVDSSTFTLDGADILDILNFACYTVDAKISGLGFKREYTINYKGQKIGEIKAAGTAIMPNVKSNKFTENMTAPGLFKVYCPEENIPIIFLWCLYLGRSEQRSDDH